MPTPGSTVIFTGPVGSQPAVAFVDRDNGDGTANLRKLLNPTELVHRVLEGSGVNSFRVVVAALP